jgi:hypothetical protein
MLRCSPVALRVVMAGFLLPLGLAGQQQHNGNSVQTPSPSSSTVRMEVPRAASASAHSPSAMPPASFAQNPVVHNPSLQGGRSMRIDQPAKGGQSQHPDQGQHGSGGDLSGSQGARGQGGGGQGRYPYVYGSYPVGVPYAFGPSFGYSAIGGDSDDYDEQPIGPQRQMAQPVEAAPPPPNDPVMATNNAPAFRPEYQGAPAAVSVRAQPATTLIFKDGRPDAKVHNYALTGSTLYALDGDTRQEIPLASLNLPATVEANRAAGVDFAVPVTR